MLGTPGSQNAAIAYRFRFWCDAAGEDQLHIRQLFVVNVRAKSWPAGPEVALVRNLRGRVSNRISRAERLEKWKEAADAYERAAELVETGRDNLLRHPKPEVLIGALRAGAAEARARQGKH